MVNLLLGGMSARELAEHCGDGETTLMSWVKKVDENGWDSLRAKKQTGQPRRLTDEQIAKLKENVSSNPNNFGFSVWDGPSLSKHIKDTFAVEHARSCFIRWGLPLSDRKHTRLLRILTTRLVTTLKKTVRIE